MKTFIDKIRFKYNRFIGNKLFPDFGWCGHCGKSWAVLSEKSIGYKKNSSHFALCQKCYDKVSLEQKIYYYTRIDYIAENPEYIKNIITNILKEHRIEYQQYLRKKKLENLLKPS